MDGLKKLAENMELEQRRQEIISRNLAGGSIPGYKQQFLVRDSFDNILKTRIEDTKILNDFTQGVLKNTNRQLDFAIGGNAFFEIQTPDGQKLYTKNGAFYVSKNRTLVTAEGYTVTGKNGNIVFGNTDDLEKMSTTSDGLIRIIDDKGKLNDIGQLKIVQTQDNDKLVRLSANYYANHDPANKIKDAAPEDIDVTNSHLESSNSSPVRDMVALIQTGRDFEMGQKMLKMLNNTYDKEMRMVSG